MDFRPKLKVASKNKELVAALNVSYWVAFANEGNAPSVTHAQS